MERNRHLIVLAALCALMVVMMAAGPAALGDILSDEEWWKKFEAESKKDRAWTGDQLVGDLKAMIPEANWGGNTNEETLSGRGLMDLIKRAIPGGNWEEEKPAR